MVKLDSARAVQFIFIRQNYRSTFIIYIIMLNNLCVTQWENVMLIITPSLFKLLWSGVSQKLMELHQVQEGTN